VVQLQQKSGLAHLLLTQFGSIDVQNDLNAHWGAARHLAEKTGMIRMLQALAIARGFRFTFVSGAVSGLLL
jgi:hypothetical protein